MIKFVVGQRWVSETEPELGLGLIDRVEGRTVRICFPAVDTVRQYAVAYAPIRRVTFRIGDRVCARDGQCFTVGTVNEQKGLLVYCDDDRQLKESDLSDQISFSLPEDRMMMGQFDRNWDFNLRYQTARLQHTLRKSPVRGFVGGRVDLVPHQFYIADETTSRRTPRVLLSDETGLGKTIEACLILHRRLISGRASRVLILLPESLVHQWFVELLRRFNLVFRIVDETYCKALEANNSGLNPFLEDQLFICGINFLVSSRKRMVQALDAKWDMMIVDEAHRVKENTPRYQMVQALASSTREMLLLTATPQQLGLEGHFARLHLLDPDRYYDFETFFQENRNYHHIAELANMLLDPDTYRDMDTQRWEKLLSDQPEPIRELIRPALSGNETERRRCIETLIDRYGIGRVMYRNTRETVSGFPERVAHLAGLEAHGEKQQLLDRVTSEFVDDNLSEQSVDGYCFDSDPRIDWLADLLNDHRDEKFLLICRNIDKALAIESSLQKRMAVKSALFHENLSLVHRDRNAAWFSEPDGARLLICSEIGSEGRNFQFAHHLVLFDLPLDPDLMEQRIGRLDRIGQKSVIHIHMPYIRGSVQEILARWYHEGLNAVESNITGVGQIADKFRLEIIELAADFSESADESGARLERLISDTAVYRERMTGKLKKGRDRLLELSSFRSDRADHLLRAVEKADSDRKLERFMVKLFDHFGIETEQIADRTYVLVPGLRFNESFPWIRDDKITVTFDRKKALDREDITFLSGDHPMVAGAMELLTGLQDGNCARGLWHDPEDASLLLETVFVLECVAPQQLHADRFLPPLPIRVVVNHKLEDVTGDCPFERMSKCMKDGFPRSMAENAEVVQSLLPKMMKESRRIAKTHVPKHTGPGLKQAEHMLEDEIRRLVDLSAVNPAIAKEEIEAVVKEKEMVCRYIEGARLRLDAMRLVWKGDVG